MSSDASQSAEGCPAELHGVYHPLWPPLPLGLGSPLPLGLPI